MGKKWRNFCINRNACPNPKICFLQKFSLCNNRRTTLFRYATASKITKKESVADNGTMSKTVDEFGREKIVFGEVHDLLKMEKEAEKTKAEAKTYEDQYIFGENEVVMDVFDKKIKEKQARDHREQNK
jgi:hypothetical protein